MRNFINENCYFLLFRWPLWCWTSREMIHTSYWASSSQMLSLSQVWKLDCFNFSEENVYDLKWHFIYSSEDPHDLDIQWRWFILHAEEGLLIHFHQKKLKLSVTNTVIVSKKCWTLKCSHIYRQMDRQMQRWTDRQMDDRGSVHRFTLHICQKWKKENTHTHTQSTRKTETKKKRKKNKVYKIKLQCWLSKEVFQWDESFNSGSPKSNQAWSNNSFCNASINIQQIYFSYWYCHWKRLMAFQWYSNT